MKFNLKPALFTVSVTFNVLFVILLLFSSRSKTSILSFYAPDGKYNAAAAVVAVPQSSSVAFESISLNLTPGEKAFLQYSFISNKKQANILINAIYDRNVISVLNSGYGIEITALSKGTTLMQTLTNDGVKDIALITVE